MNGVASRRNETARKLLEQGNYKQAEKQLRKAINAAQDWSVPWFHLGLVYKRQNRWQESLESNQRAAALDPDDKAAFWNMGIAATAIGNWSVAREAWTAYGVPLPEGNGPIKMTNFGPTPIRLNPLDNGEVVWCTRIDPARAIIENIPLPASCHCYHDLVLHDGEPKGFRQHNGNEVPVFEALEILRVSVYQTYEVHVVFRSLEDIEVLIEMASQRDLAVEDWSTIRRICKHCSEGRPHEIHEIEPPTADKPAHIGAAARNQTEAISLFEAWQKERQGCGLVEIECVFAH